MCSRLIGLLALALVGNGLVGCVSQSACGQDFVAGNDSCAPGCSGIRVSRAERCVWAGEELTWCVERRTVAPEDTPCVADTTTGLFYRSYGYPAEMPAGVRFCTSEEEAMLGDFTGCE